MGIAIAVFVFLMSLFGVIPGLLSSDHNYQMICFWYVVCLIGVGVGWPLSNYAEGYKARRDLGPGLAGLVYLVSWLMAAGGMLIGMWLMFIVMLGPNP